MALKLVSHNHTMTGQWPMAHVARRAKLVHSQGTQRTYYQSTFAASNQSTCPGTPTPHQVQNVQPFFFARQSVHHGNHGLRIPWCPNFSGGGPSHCGGTPPKQSKGRAIRDILGSTLGISWPYLAVPTSPQACIALPSETLDAVSQTFTQTPWLDIIPSMQVKSCMPSKKS